MAIQDLAQRLGNRSMAPLAPDLALLTTAEPCSMCMSAILWARFGAVYYGASIPFLAEHGWAQIDLRATQVADAAGKGLPQHVEIYDGILQSECEALYSRGPPVAP
jgi:tRNA(Arg) A34 adenosine deaminase TadA